MEGVELARVELNETLAEVARRKTRDRRGPLKTSRWFVTSEYGPMETRVNDLRSRGPVAVHDSRHVDAWPHAIDVERRVDRAHDSTFERDEVARLEWILRGDDDGDLPGLALLGGRCAFDRFDTPVQPRSTTP